MTYIKFVLTGENTVDIKMNWDEELIPSFILLLNHLQQGKMHGMIASKVLEHGEDEEDLEGTEAILKNMIGPAKPPAKKPKALIPSNKVMAHNIELNLGEEE